MHKAPNVRIAGRRGSRRGVSLLGGVFSLTVMTGMASFAVDYGRVQLAKSELRRAADAAARVGAGSLAVSNAQARFDAQSWSKKNAVDGRFLTDDGIAVTLGRWNTNSRTFTTALGFGEGYNAVRVVLARPAAGPESVPMLWGGLLGLGGKNVTAECIAMYVPGINVVHNVDGTANPFLAGMPTGSVASLNNPHKSPDYAGDPTSTNAAIRRQSPTRVPMPVTAGDIIQFDEPAVGTVRHDPNLPFVTPDGELTNIGKNTNGSENGISDLKAPINALVGVFLSDARPDQTLAPTVSPNHSPHTEKGRDFSELAPQLKETFFIGDGINSGGTRQSFKVPQGATRLYLATWDFYEWNNNAGSRTIKVQRPGRVVTVK